MNTSVNYPLRNTVRVILLNDKNELLLMRIDDPKTKSIDGKYQGMFWVMVGGRIKDNEDVKKAAIRELFEETNIRNNEVKFGPVVWQRELALILYGKAQHLNEKYIVARTKKRNVQPAELTEYESKIVKELKWFSLDQIVNCKETIYPPMLSHYLHDIIVDKYPHNPIKIE